MSLIDFENEKTLSERITEFCNSLLLKNSQNNQEYLLDAALDALYTLKLIQRKPTLDRLNTVFNEWLNEKHSNEVLGCPCLFFKGESGQFVSITTSSDELKGRMMARFFCDTAFQKNRAFSNVAVFLSTITTSSFLRKVVDCLEFKMQEIAGKSKKESSYSSDLYDEAFRLLEESNASIDFYPDMSQGVFHGTLMRLKSKYNTRVILLDNISQQSKLPGNMNLDKYLRLIAEENKVSIVLFKSNSD